MVGSATIINVLRTFSHANDVLFVAHDHVNYFCFSLIKSCPTLCDPIDGSPPGSRVPGILQARTLEWVSISFSNA